MTSNLSKFNNCQLFIVFISSLYLVGCNDGVVEIKTEQVRAQQILLNSIAAGCEGKLSMSITTTGDIQNPANYTVSCSEMDKKSELFRVLSDEDLEQVKAKQEELSKPIFVLTE
ncbi:hypothetical protein A1OO_05945 [Enterovibrio norvegicus FF-33]|uniref:hypothetical protein n=1 Tax=Enterovibrio norvegicus TaxID=188144 RepID=UPI00038119D9|nr:hypothetical protein [Enterovibrio norvegicus]OEE70307.1 hypothetical protein A1OO_05945 [Enterovibrio norvegicus FF-33]